MSLDGSALALDSPVQFVRGVGPARARKFERLNIRTVADLLWHLPRELVDLTHVIPPSELVDGEFATVRGRVADLEGRSTARGGTLSIVLLLCDGGGASAGGYVRGMWFNQPWQLNKFRGALANGNEVLFSGKPKYKAGKWEFSHPQVQVLTTDSVFDDALADDTDDTEDPDGQGQDGEDHDGNDKHGDGTSSAHLVAIGNPGLLPKYGLTDGLNQHHVRRATREAVVRASSDVAEILPESFRQRLDLVAIPTALVGIHAPRIAEDYTAGRRRILFGDLFEFQLGLALRRRAWKATPTAPSIEVTAKIDARIRRLFPFRCTSGQDAAIRDVVADLGQPFAMHRLLQADVGAGKTIIAIYGMLATVAAGYQTVMMAPTELLAAQHAATIESVLAGSRVRRRLLTGRLTSAERRDSLAKIAAGEVDLVVGTQAVIQKDVDFPQLGLVVIDEQHKFGVAQRAHFSRLSREGISPHVLVMTATPIPRSLCLTQFGDLDLSVVKERPPGRQPITTARVLTSVQRRKMWDFVRKKMREGRQAYIVSPRVDGDDDVPGAERLFSLLQETELRDQRIGLLHGRLAREERDAVMDQFRFGELDAVVATTVIEVGVDVPNASLMIIESANLFGLSQLHQLRGRVGRGSHRSFCFLVADAETSGGETTTAAARLAVMEETEDGFAIAERDFEIRGGGDILGTRQAGESPLKFADLVRDRDLLAEARKAAFDLVASSEIDAPEYAALKRHVLDRFGELMELPRSG